MPLLPRSFIQQHSELRAVCLQDARQIAHDASALEDTSNNWDDEVPKTGAHHLKRQVGDEISRRKAQRLSDRFSLFDYTEKFGAALRQRSQNLDAGYLGADCHALGRQLDPPVPDRIDASPSVQYGRRANQWMTGKGKLLKQIIDAGAIDVLPWSRLEEDRLKMPELLRDAQHLIRIESVGIGEYRETIAAVWGCSENIDMNEGSTHGLCCVKGQIEAVW
jgi:hypothetical protein